MPKIAAQFVLPFDEVADVESVTENPVAVVTLPLPRPPDKSRTRRCADCRRTFSTTRRHAKTCSPACRQRLHRLRTAPRTMSTVHGTNAALIAHVAKLHLPAGALVADVTWGRGMFWTKARGGDFTLYGSDLAPRLGAAIAADFRQLPYRDECIDVAVLDPPYLSHPERAALYKIGEQYNGPGTVGGLDHEGIVDLYRDGMREAARVLKPGGQLWVKCKDELVDRRQRRLHIEVYEIAAVLGLVDRDQFILVANSGGPNGKRAGVQKHARKRHSYLWIFERRTAG